MIVSQKNKNSFDLKEALALDRFEYAFEQKPYNPSAMKEILDQWRDQALFSTYPSSADVAAGVIFPLLNKSFSGEGRQAYLIDPRWQIVSMLLDIDFPATTQLWDGMSLLRIACTCGDIPLIKRLIDAGGDLFESKDKNSICPIHKLVSLRELPPLHDLMGSYIKQTDMDSSGRNFLFYAVCFIHLDLVGSLLESGWSPSVLDHDRNHILHFAMADRSGQMLEKLLPYGQDLINLPNDDGKVPLHLAIGNNMPLCVEALLAAGANPLLEHPLAQTPLEYAEEANSPCYERLFAVAERLRIQEHLKNAPASLSELSANDQLKALHSNLNPQAEASAIGGSGDTVDGSLSGSCVQSVKNRSQRKTL